MLQIREEHRTDWLADAGRVASPRTDPTGTTKLRAAFRRDMDSRWAKVKSLVRDSIEQQDPLIHIAHADRIAAFNAWLDDVLRQTFGNGVWMAKYLDGAFRLARERSSKLIRAQDAGPEDEPRDPAGRWTSGTSGEWERTEEHSRYPGSRKYVYQRIVSTHKGTGKRSVGPWRRMLRSSVVGKPNWVPWRIRLDAQDYDPDEPRVPAGEPGGGEWTSGGGYEKIKAEALAEAHKTEAELTPEQHAMLAAERQHYERMIEDGKERYAQINDQLLPYVLANASDDTPQVRGLMKELEEVSQQINTVRRTTEPAELGAHGPVRDVTIVGAGPAGLQAAANGAYEGLDTTLIEANTVAGGQAKYSSRIENLIGYPKGVTGEQLAKDGYEQAKRMGAELKLGARVTGLVYDPATGLKHLTLANGEHIDSRAVILAGGLEFRKPTFPGAEGPNVTVGNGKAVAEQAKGGAAVVIGGGNSASQAALGAAQQAERVYLLSRSPLSKGMSAQQIVAVRANPKITVIEGDEIAKLFRKENGEPERIETKNGGSLPCKAVGLFIGSLPETDWLKGVERETDPKSKDRGKIKADANHQTNMPGVFVAGDMRAGSRGRVGVAIGDGQLALADASDYVDTFKKKRSAKDALTLDAVDGRADLIRRHFELDREYPWFTQSYELEWPALATTHDAAPDDSELAVASLAQVELQGICDATAQQATRAFADGGLVNKRKLASNICRKIDGIGRLRSRMLVNAISIKAFSTATLDAFRRAGIQRVGTIPERRRRQSPHSTNGSHGARDAGLDKWQSAAAVIRDQDEDDEDRLEALEEELGPDATVEVITAGDDKVCQLCEDISDEGPYDLDEAAALIPAHPNCRCAFVPADDARFASVRDAGPSDEPRDEHGRWTEGGETFVSPQTGAINFAGAQAALGSHRQKYLGRAFNAVDRELGLDSKSTPVIGAWRDGAENSILMHHGEGVSWDTVRAAAAMKGWLANQKQVLIFQHDGQGDSFLSNFNAKGDLDGIHDYLLAHGLEYHTLEPVEGGARVYVYGDSPDTVQAVTAAGEHYGSGVQTRQGRGEFIGTQKQDGSDAEQRADARQSYERVIAESRTRGATAAWRSIRDRFRRPDTVKDQGIGAAGVLFYTPEGYALFAKRKDTGEWSIPAGLIEPGEDPAHAAQREAVEEVAHPGDHRLAPLDRRSHNGIDFHTFSQGLAQPFRPILNNEHTQARWALLSRPPRPLHPGLRATLAMMRKSARKLVDFNPYHVPAGSSEGGQFTSGGEATPVYHGTIASGFTKFERPDPRKEIALDRAIGTHVAKDPQVANVYTREMNFLTGSLETNKFAGSIYELEIPPDDKFMTLDQSKGERAPAAITDLVHQNALAADPDYFAKWKKDYGSGYYPITGDDKKSQDARVHAVDLFHQEMAKQGYIGIKYNVDPTSFPRGAKDPTAYVVFDPANIRSRFGHEVMGGPGAAEPIPSTLPSGERNSEWVAQIAHEVFDELDHHGPLMVDNNEPEQRSIGDTKYQIAGTANQRGLVTLYPKAMGFMTRDDVAGLTAHEIEHVKFQRAKDAHDREFAEILKLPHDPDPKKDVMRADGLLNEPYDKQFPNYQDFEKAYFLPNADDWRKGDGVSNYSIDWWKEQQANRARNENAINETLAEMAKAKYITGALPDHAGPLLIRFRERDPETGEPKPKPGKAEIDRLTQQWRDLYNAVSRINKRLDRNPPSVLRKGPYESQILKGEPT